MIKKTKKPIAKSYQLRAKFAGVVEWYNASLPRKRSWVQFPSPAQGVRLLKEEDDAAESDSAHTNLREKMLDQEKFFSKVDLVEINLKGF